MISKENVLWLKLGSPVLLLAFLAGCLGSGGPSSEVLRLAAGSDEAGRFWHQAGVENPISFSLPKKAPAPKGGFTHQLPSLTYLTVRTSEWTPEDISDTAAHAPAAFAHCGIRMTSVQLIRGDLKYGALAGKEISNKDSGRIRNIIQKSPSASGVTLIFVDKIANKRANDPIQGLVLEPGSPAIAALAASTVKPPSNQIVAHQLGRLLGLTQVAQTGSEPESESEDANLMHPSGCRKCTFTSSQCDKLKAHPLVSKITREQA